jgi:Domain of unknown function (DUF397)
VARDEATRQWRKSSRSETDHCVEVRTDPDGVWVRSSTDLDGPPLSFSYRQWDAFLASVRRGQFQPAAT